MMAKRNKYITKALEFFKWVYEEDEEFPLDTVRDIDFLIKQAKELISKYEIIVQEYQDGIEQQQKNVDNLEALKNQVEVEEFREMNPRAKDVFKL